MISTETNNYRDGFEYLISILCALTLILFAIDYHYSSIIIFLLFIFSFFSLVFKKSKTLPDQDKYISLIRLPFIIYPLAVFISLVYHQQWDIFFKELDNPMRWLYALVILYFLENRALNYKLIMSGFPYAAILMSIFSIYYYNGDRVSLVYNNPIQLGNVATSLFLICVAVFLFSIKHRFNILYFLGAVCSVVVIFLSGTKSGYLVVFLLTLFSFIFYRRIWWVYLLIGLIFAILIQFNITPFAFERISLMSKNVSCILSGDLLENCGEGGFSIRLLLIKIGLLNFLENPFFGSGLMSTSSVIDAAKQTPPLVIKSYDHLHNDIIENVSQMGLIGLISTISLYFMPLLASYKYIKQKNGEFKIFVVTYMANVMAMFFSGLSEAILTHSATSTYYAFTMLLLAAFLINAIRDNHLKS